MYTINIDYIFYSFKKTDNIDNVSSMLREQQNIVITCVFRVFQIS